MAHPAIVIPSGKSGCGPYDYLQFVLQQNPYDIDPSGVTLPSTALVDGPAWANTVGNGYSYGRSLSKFLEAVGKGYDPKVPGIAPGGEVLTGFLNWRFGEENVRISKALMLTYDYDGTKAGEADSDETLPHKFTGRILIGYAGPAWP